RRHQPRLRDRRNRPSRRGSRLPHGSPGVDRRIRAHPDGHRGSRGEDRAQAQGDRQPHHSAPRLPTHVVRRRAATADLVAAQTRQGVGAAVLSIAAPRRSGSDHGDLTDRILDAAQRLVFRTGARKLSLSDVATLARVSRPTVYRYFVSKEELIDALGRRERRRFSTAMDEAMYGLVGVARLEAAVNVIATFVEAQPPGRLLDLEPGFAHEQAAQALPMLADGLVGVLQRCAREGAFTTELDPRDLAGAIARTALSHYIF